MIEHKPIIFFSSLFRFAVSFFLIGLVFTSFACKKATYPESQIVSSIQAICKKEYDVEGVEVKLVGKTIGVFLPLKKLFVADVRHLVMSGKMENLESLFEPEPEAMDKLEDVLFTISRVMLSTDKEIDFYVLKAADVEATGLQLVLTGYIPDVRRVRLWDIPRSEYRKRVFHELKLNRTILWEEPVRSLFARIQEGQPPELQEGLQEGQQKGPWAPYFFLSPRPETVSPIFYEFLTHLEDRATVKLEFLEMRSYPYGKVQALVYVKLKEYYELKPGVSPYSVPYPSGTELEYIFVVEPGEDAFKIIQIIPFQYLDETQQMRQTKFPPELNLYEDLEEWSERFEVEEVFLGEFLARQLNRRSQGLLIMDERVRLTLKQARLNFSFLGAREEQLQHGEIPRFLLNFYFLPKSIKTEPAPEEAFRNEDVVYVLDVLLKEFNSVVYGYSFRDYDRLDLIWESDHSSAPPIEIPQNSLELFRRKKLGTQELLAF